jgi:citrate lyase subunit beta/citryl-CoA lyase
VRSLLFAGATRPDLVAKLGRSAPDAVVIDLEDAVPPEHKERARPMALEGARALAAACPGLPIYVRVNPAASGLLEADVAGAVVPSLAGVVLPKLERGADLERLRAALGGAGCGELLVIAGLESARGVADARSLLELGVHAAYFGAEDYAADLGAVRTAGGEEVLYARSHVVLACRLCGVLPIDQAVVEFREDERFAVDARRGRALGYRGKLCIHPAQVALAHEAFTPSAREVDQARRILAAWEERAGDGVGALEVDGQMVDEPALRLARAVLAAAPTPSPPPPPAAAG